MPSACGCSIKEKVEDGEMSFGTTSVGRKNDRRWKLSPQAIRAIKFLYSHGIKLSVLAKRFKVCRATVYYWVNYQYRTRMRDRNKLRTRTPIEERENSFNKQIRRNLVRQKVRDYTRKQMRAYRKTHLEWARKTGRENSRIWREKHRKVPERNHERPTGRDDRVPGV